MSTRILLLDAKLALPDLLDLDIADVRVRGRDDLKNALLAVILDQWLRHHMVGGQTLLQIFLSIMSEKEERLTIVRRIPSCRPRGG